MLDEKGIAELKRTYQDLGKRLEKIDKKQLPIIIRLAERLKELLEDIELVRDKDKNTWNPAFTTRMRLAKKGVELYKDLVQFEKDVAAEFEKGNLSVDAGKRLISIVKLLKDPQVVPARKEFEYFDELLDLKRRYDAAAEELAEQGRALRRERNRLERLLADLSALENERVDQEKVRAYAELLENLQALQKVRADYLDSLLSKPVAELIGLENPGLELPPKEELAGLKKFFSDYPEFGRCDVVKLCEFFGYSEKKLSHLCPETTRFRRVVAGNKSFFESIRFLKQTAFLKVDDSDGAVMDFYARQGEAAQKAVERIRELAKDRQSAREEYERSRQLEKRRGELSAYSKKELEAGMAEADRLLGLLESVPQPSGERPGIFSAFGSILRKALT
jgi:hypothetical protein